MTPDELMKTIERLRSQQSDDAQTETKECRSSLSPSVWETVSAFANTSGGYLLLGVSEADGFQPVKGFALEKVLSQFVSGMGDAGSGARVTNPPSYRIERHNLQGMPVLGIAVSALELLLRPCFITDKGINAGSYKRIDDRDVRLSPTEVYSMTNVMMPSQADSSVVDGALPGDLDDALTRSLISQAETSAPKALRDADTLEAKLTRLNVLRQSGGVTMAGLLTCGCYPQQFLPKAVVDVAAHAGNEKALPGSPRFLDRTVCEGPLGEVVDDAVHAVMKNLRVASVVQGAGRVDVPEIPMEVLREAISNAVVHREYGALFLGQAVQVDVYSDRVEITSPGGLWGGKTLENLDDGQSRCRNATLMHLAALTDLPKGQGRAAEGGGTGVGMMRREMEQLGLPGPEFIAEPDCFTVRFPRRDPFLENAAPYSADGKAAVAKGRVSKDAVLEALSTSKPRNIRELSDAVGASANAVRAHLRNLIAEGSVVATAPVNSRNRAYLKAH